MPFSFIPQTKARSSPLIAASGNREVAQLLINNGAIINNKDGVCDNCHYYNIAIILLKSVSPQYGKTVLHFASEEGHPEVVVLLVQSHANVNVKNNVSTYRITSLVPLILLNMYTVNLEMFAVD